MAKTIPPASLDISAEKLDKARVPAGSLNQQDAVPLLLLAGIVVFLYWKVLFTSQMLFFRDIFNFSYPHARLIQAACRRGELPYWNPYLNFGRPVLADPLTLFFYPDTLFIVIWPLNFAFPMHFVLHFWIAAAGAYALARRWGQSRLAAFFAASVFTFSGPVFSLNNFYNLVACAAWIPWALLATDQALEGRAQRPWVLLTVVFALQFLAGEPMTLMATFALCLGYAFFRRGTLRRPIAAAHAQILSYFVIVSCLAALLCAVQFLPSLDLLQRSGRSSGLSYGQSTYWSFHPLLLLEVLFPDFFGSPFGVADPWKLVLNSRDTPLLLSFYVGMIPLIFALVGWVSGRGRCRHFAAVSVMALVLLSFGQFTPVYRLVFLALPPVRLVRFPVKLLIPAMLGVAMLAGMGTDALRETGWRLGRKRLGLFLPLTALLLVSVAAWTVCWLEPGWIAAPAKRVIANTNRLFVLRPSDELSAPEIEAAGKYFVHTLRIHLPGLLGYSLGALAWLLALERGKRWASWAIPWVVMFGVLFMVRTNYPTNLTVPKSFYTYRPPVLAHFENLRQPYRFFVPTGPPQEWEPKNPVQSFLSFDSIPQATGLSEAAVGLFREKIVLHWGTMLSGYESATWGDVDRSLPRSHYEFWSYVRVVSQDPLLSDCLIGRGNVRYLLLDTPRPNPVSIEVAEVPNGSPAPSHLYKDLCAVPRAFAVASAFYSTSPTQTLALLAQPEFDATGRIILASKPDPAFEKEQPDGAGRVDIIERANNSVTLRSNLYRPGYVVLTDRFDPNWHATLDGREVPILRANQMFRAVRSEAGMHEIHFYYRQAGLRAGVIVSAGTLLLLAFLYWLDPRPGSISRNPE